MKSNNKNISKEDIQRYMENQMTGTERNAFERELQKHPFEAEALEGFQQISAADLKNDLNELSGKITSKKQKSNTRFWAAAATFLLLISAGVAWFQLKEISLFPEIAETKTIQKEEVKIPASQAETTSQEFNKPIGEQDKTATFDFTEEPGAKKIATKQLASKPVPVTEKEEKIQIQKSIEEKTEPIQIADNIASVTKVAALRDSQNRIRGTSTLNSTQKSAIPETNVQANKMAVATATTKVLKGKIISVEDSLPLPGVTILEKGTANGTISDRNGNFALRLTNRNDSVIVANFIGMKEKEFYSTHDSNLVVGLEPSQLALNEVVTIGYGVMKKSPMEESVKNAQPKGEMSSFRKYIDEHAILPESYAENKVTVKVVLKINTKGEISSVENKNNSDSTVFELARQILLNGPAWNPKTINGTPVESDTALKLIFKK